MMFSVQGPLPQKEEVKEVNFKFWGSAEKVPSLERATRNRIVKNVGLMNDTHYDQKNNQRHAIITPHF